MRTIFHIIRASIFLMLTSFASTALSITINSELGSASLDGAWGFACEVPDPGDPDEIEVLEFAGSTVKAYVIEYASMDGSCTGGGTIIPEVEGTVVANDFEFGVIWIDEDDNLNNPPERLDGLGLMTMNPVVTPLEFLVTGEPPETAFFFMDDTILSLGGTACLYRDAGSEYPNYSNNIQNEERRCKIDSPDGIPPIPVPAAFWLFGTALIGFVGMSRRRKVS